MAGAQVVATDDVESVSNAAMVWLNTPSNPTGAVLDAQRLASIVEWARDNDAVVVSDECYIELGWTAEPVSILNPQVNGGDTRGLLAVHSLSKRSSMAGYRFGFLAGDSEIIGRLLGIRKHLGMMVPAPIQHAAIAAYDDDAHVAEQRARYERRRGVLAEALQGAGFRIDHSEAGLYLWVTRGEDAWTTAGVGSTGVPTERSTIPSSCDRARAATSARVSQGNSGNRRDIRSPAN